MTNNPQLYTCAYTLDQRLDEELVQAFEEAGQALNSAFANGRAQMQFRHDDGLPAEPWRAWVVYIAALICGAHNALLTLLLHNLGREARIMERTMYEYFIKARYYAKNKEEAKLEFYAAPFRALKLLDELNDDKSSERYRDAVEITEILRRDTPQVAKHAADNRGQERSFGSMVKDIHAEAAREEYAFYYRQQSQTAHASVIGMADVLEFNHGGKIGALFVKFDSRQDYPNWSVFFGLQHIINFLALVEDELGIKVPIDLPEHRNRLLTILKRLVQQPEPTSSP